MPIPKLQQKRAESGVFRSKDMLAILRANINPKWINDMCVLAGVDEATLGDRLAEYAVTSFGVLYPTNWNVNYSLRNTINQFDKNIITRRDAVKNNNTHSRGECFFFTMFGIPVHTANGYIRTGIAAEVASILMRGESPDITKQIAIVMKRAKLAGSEIDESIARAVMDSVA